MVTVFSQTYITCVNNLINRVNTIYNDTILNRIYSNVGNAKLWRRTWYRIYCSQKIKTLLIQFYNYQIDGEFDKSPISSKGTIFSLNFNSTYSFSGNTFAQFNYNYLSNRITAQGQDSRFYSQI